MKRHLLLLLLLFIGLKSYAQQADFITIWDLTKTGSGANKITFNVTTAVGQAVKYTWTSDGVSPTSGSGTIAASSTAASIVGLPTGQIITLSIEPQNLRSFKNSGIDKLRLTDVKQWGAAAWITMNNAFNGCANLNITASDIPNLSSVSDMMFMFDGCSILNGPGNIGSWNTSAVTNMNGMFSSARVFNQNIGAWNTAAVTDMGNMFSGATAFNQNIGAWNTAAVRNMSWMFLEANAFNQDIGTWNTSAVTLMNGMFWGASVFNKNIGTWNTAAVTNMSNMFVYSYAFNQNIGAWNTAAVTNMNNMFHWASAFNQNIGAWNTASVTSMMKMFYNASAFNQNIGNWNLNASVNMDRMFINSGLNCANYSSTLRGWADNNSTPANMYLGTTGRTYGTDAAAARAVLISKGWTIDGDVAGSSACNLPFVTTWDLTKTGSGPNQISFNVTTAANQTINYTWTANGGTPSSGSGSITANATTANIQGLPAGQIITLSIEPQNLKAFNINNAADKLRLTDVKQWGTSNWTSMANAFYGCANLNISATDLPNLSNVTSMSLMFTNCVILNGPTNIGVWNTAAVTNMYGMFTSATTFNQNIGAWNTSAVTNMKTMFYNASAFDQNIGAWNTAAVGSMGYMFYGASAFNQNIGAWNTAAVKDMSNMFYNAFAFNQNIGAWNTAAVTNMYAMFLNAATFNQNIGNWNTAAVTDMNYMFYKALAFNQNIGAWNTAAVTNMNSMFHNASAFNQNLSNWHLSAGVEMSNMFNYAGLDCANYSSTLIGWANHANTPPGRTIGTLGITYGTDAVTARNTLIGKGWSFNGDIAGNSACLGTLPVNFGEFSGTKQANSVKLTWNTLSESNNKGFLVQKSTDGIISMDLAFVASKGTTANNYTILDNNPTNGANYYRLTQQDINGRITDLGTKIVNFVLANEGVKAWPNPVNDVLNVSFVAGKYQKLTLVDVNGKKLQEINLSANQSVAKVAMINYPKGVFVLALKGKEGNHQLKIVK